jgi:hypothetical protein
MMDLSKKAFGYDVNWWAVPTHPELRTNYFERVWPKKEIRMMRKMEKFEVDTEDSDPDKKLFSVEIKKSRTEKKLFWILFAATIVSWVFVV